MPISRKRQAAAVRPAADRAQQIAVAATDVEQRQRLARRRSPHRGVEPGEHRPVPEHRAVEPGEALRDRRRARPARASPYRAIRAHWLRRAKSGTSRAPERHDLRRQAGAERHGAAFGACARRVAQQLRRARTSRSPTTCCRSRAAPRAKRPAPRRRDRARARPRRAPCGRRDARPTGRWRSRRGAADDVAGVCMQAGLDRVRHAAGQHHVEAGRHGCSR